ncbi:MAG: succinate dehydrogenase cytochrome b subunit [Longimicrobiales bacterium]|nr:succinate dehydrogenase cytochrome b subunit [Longimicrobiales bacterium]
MRRVASLYRSSVGKKILMALSGLILFGFIVGHMVGNLKVLSGPEAFNHYAEFLREVGYPLLPHQSFLWGFRLLLLGAVFLHAISALQLWNASRAARGGGYGRKADISFSYASRTMRWGGVILALFIVYHILHLTTGSVHADFIPGDVYHNYVTAFQSPLIFALYAVAQAALCFHLYHGLWSVTQTLGANHPRYNPLRRPVAVVVSLGIFVGFLIPPVLVLAGVVS